MSVTGKALAWLKDATTKTFERKVAAGTVAWVAVFVNPAGAATLCGLALVTTLTADAVAGTARGLWWLVSKAVERRRRKADEARSRRDQEEYERRQRQEAEAEARRLAEEEANQPDPVALMTQATENFNRLMASLKAIEDPDTRDFEEANARREYRAYMQYLRDLC